MSAVEVPVNAFQQLPELFGRSEQALVIRSIAAGHTPARAWIDRREQPSAALVWDKMSGLYLAGQPGQSDFLACLGKLLRESILPDVRERSIPEMEIFYDHPAWEPGLTAIVPDELHPYRAFFNSYELVHPQAHREVNTRPGFTITPVDKALLAQHDLDHLEHLTGWILSFYRTPDEFFKTGFGYVAISESDQAIASLCITVFVAASMSGSGQDYELGLATAPEYRQLGLAASVAAASVGHCLAAGSTPVWHCWADNHPSIRVAEKVGFILLRQTPAVRFPSGI